MSNPFFLFVYPEVPDTYWSYKHALSFVGKRALMPPLGLATVAAMVPHDYECRIVDLNVERLPSRIIEKADLVLISAMIVQASSLHSLIRRCNSIGTPVALGGPYATSCHSDIDGVTYFILGEGERSFRQFLTDYKAGHPGKVYLSNDRPALSEAPVPRFDLLKLDLYDSVPLQFSRGCPFDCDFCDIVHLYGHRPRTKSPAQFIAEMDAVYRTRSRGSVFVVDDNFIGNRRGVKELLKEVAIWQRAHGRPFSFSTEASIDLAADEELLDLMVAAGFGMVFIGIESPDPESLAAVGKLQNLRRDVVESVRKIQGRGIEVTAGFIIGFDSDLPDIFDLQIDYIQKLAIPTAMVGLLTALPNTKLFDRLNREGRILSRSSGNNTHTDALNFVPRMPRKDLEAGYYRVLETIYQPKRYFERCLAVLRRYPRAMYSDQLKRRISWREIVGLANSLVRQTFSKYGFSYLWYMVRALRTRPDLIAAVVTMAIQGHHYFTITNRVMARRRRIVTTEPVRGRMTQLIPEPTV